MKNIIGGAILLILVSCSNDATMKSSAISEATRFVSDYIDSAIVVTDNNGVVSVGDGLVRYVISPTNIFYDEIDELPGKEILITIDSLHDPYLMPLWHLVLVEDKEQLKIKNTIRSDIRILDINKGIITAEIPTHAPSSPLYYCSECRDTVDYRIAGGRFVISDE